MNILIAEDTQLLQIYDIELMELWGYDFDMASNGEEAVEYAIKNEGKYDLCIMDIEMPVMNGLEATRQIREKTKYFPIMAFSSNSEFRQPCLENDFDDFVLKPTNIKHLYQKINELTVKSYLLHSDKSNISIEQVKPMNSDDLKELKSLKQKGLTKLKLLGLDHTFIVHKNIQNKISHDLIGDGKEISEFIDRSKEEPGRCHLYKINLHITKDLFTPDELEEAINAENEIATKFTNLVEKSSPE